MLDVKQSKSRADFRHVAKRRRLQVFGGTRLREHRVQQQERQENDSATHSRFLFKKGRAKNGVCAPWRRDIQDWPSARFLPLGYAWIRQRNKPPRRPQP